MSAAELDALWLSLSVAARSVAINLPFAILVAWLLTRARFAGRTVFDAFVHLPLVLPPVVVGYLLLVLFGVRGPIGGWLYDTFGIRLAFTTNGAALATAVMSFPLVVRSIRISLEMPTIFKAQLRAILRASAQGEVRILFPMISSVEEIRRAKELLEEARQELDEIGEPYDRAMPVGIMIEVPAAVWLAPPVFMHVRGRAGGTAWVGGAAGSGSAGHFGLTGGAAWPSVSCPKSL